MGNWSHTKWHIKNQQAANQINGEKRIKLSNNKLIVFDQPLKYAINQCAMPRESEKGLKQNQFKEFSLSWEST